MSKIQTTKRCAGDTGEVPSRLLSAPLRHVGYQPNFSRGRSAVGRTLAVVSRLQADLRALQPDCCADVWRDIDLRDGRSHVPCCWSGGLRAGKSERKNTEEAEADDQPTID